MIQGWGMTETNPLEPYLEVQTPHLKLRRPAFENIAKAGLASPGLEIEIFDG